MELFAMGSYTSPQGHVPQGRGEGVSILGFDADASSPFYIIESHIHPDNPTFLVWDGRRRLLHAPSEAGDTPGSIHSYHVDDYGHARQLHRHPGTNADICHVSLDPGHGLLFGASYGGGRVSAYRLDEHGFPSDPESHVYVCPPPSQGSASRPGTGDPAPVRQPHAHQISPAPGGKRVYVTDLGCDRILSHEIRPDQNSSVLLGPAVTALKLPPGSGPRHMAFDPGGKLVFILCELTPMLICAALKPEEGSLELLETHKLPGTGPQSPAAIKIHPSGKTLAVSSRFLDRIFVFRMAGATWAAGATGHHAVPGSSAAAGEKSAPGQPALVPGADESDSATGKILIPSGDFPCGGKTPRDMEFSPDGSLLLVANQDSHTLSSLRFDPETGLCSGQEGPGLEAASPSCLICLT